MKRPATNRWRPIGAAVLICLPWLAHAASWPGEARYGWTAAPSASPFDVVRRDVRTSDPFAVVAELPRARSPRLRDGLSRQRAIGIDGDVGTGLPKLFSGYAGPNQSLQPAALEGSVSPEASITGAISARLPLRAAVRMRLPGVAPRGSARNAWQVDHGFPVPGLWPGAGQLSDLPCLGAVSAQQCAR